MCVHPCKVCFQHSRLKLKLINTQNYCRVIWPWSYTFLKNIEDSSQLLAAVGVFFLKGVCFWDFQCGLLDFFDATVCHLWWYMIIYRIWFSHTCTPVDAVDIDTAFIFSLILYMETEKTCNQYRNILSVIGGLYHPVNPPVSLYYQTACLIKKRQHYSCQLPNRQIEFG